LFIEYEGERYGSYIPSGGPIPLHKYRSFKKTDNEKRAERIEKLAKKLSLPKSALEYDEDGILYEIADDEVDDNMRPFEDPDPYQEIFFPNVIAAKQAIANYIGAPLAELNPDQREKIDQILSKTLIRSQVFEKIRNYFNTIEERKKQKYVC